MDTVFNINAAIELIKQMDKYCTTIQYEARAILDVLQGGNKWNDAQSSAFQKNLMSICGDLNKALQAESNYMNEYRQRVKELRG